MQVFPIPVLHVPLETCLVPVFSKEKPPPYISHSLSAQLHQMKTEIDKYDTSWNIYKKITNEYEYINTTLPKGNSNVAGYRPISRAYFKMVELINHFDLGLDSPHPIRTFHLAEGPGGFIEALVNYRKARGGGGNCAMAAAVSCDKYIGMTLVDTSKTDIGWKKGRYFIQNNLNIFLEHGFDLTGNILSIDNYVYVKNKYGSTMDFITADGGFDFSDDFNHQECNMLKLLYGQVVYAISLQKPHGCFVLKIFDTFLHATLDILAILSSVYKKVYITKPVNSRQANSEKYLVCIDFMPWKATDTREEAADASPMGSFMTTPLTTDLETVLYTSLKNVLQFGSSKLHKGLEGDSGGGDSEGAVYISRFLKGNRLPAFFMREIQKSNVLFGGQQLKNIQQTLDMIEGGSHPSLWKDKEKLIQRIIRFNVLKCVQWCEIHLPPFTSLDSTPQPCFLPTHEHASQREDVQKEKYNIQYI